MTLTLVGVRGSTRGVTDTTLTASAVNAAGVCACGATPAAAGPAAAAKVEAAVGAAAAMGEGAASSSSKGWEVGPSWLAQLASGTGWEEGRLAAAPTAPNGSNTT